MNKLLNYEHNYNLFKILNLRLFEKNQIDCPLFEQKITK